VCHRHTVSIRTRVCVSCWASMLHCFMPRSVRLVTASLLPARQTRRTSMKQCVPSTVTQYRARQYRPTRCIGTVGTVLTGHPAHLHTRSSCLLRVRRWAHGTAMQCQGPGAPWAVVGLVGTQPWGEPTSPTALALHGRPGPAWLRPYWACQAPASTCVGLGST